jgi:fatty acid desaturase
VEEKKVPRPSVMDRIKFILTLTVSFFVATWVFWFWASFVLVICYIPKDPLGIAVAIGAFWLFGVLGWNIHKGFTDKTPIDDWVSRRWETPTTPEKPTDVA